MGAPLSRLQTTERLMLQTPPAVSTPVDQVIKPAGTAWTIFDKRSQLDGSESYVAILPAVSTVANVINAQAQPSFGLACTVKGLTVSFVWPDFVEVTEGGFRNYATVAWKLDRGAVEKTDFSATHGGVFLNGRSASGWLDRLGASQRLVVRVPDGHGGQEATFVLSGVDRIVSDAKVRGCS